MEKTAGLRTKWAYFNLSYNKLLNRVLLLDNDKRLKTMKIKFYI